MLRSLTGLRAINTVYNPMRLLTSATANTLKVKEEVKRERQLALLGGGQKRIDAQHKKGTYEELIRFYLCFVFFLLRKINCT